MFDKFFQQSLAFRIVLGCFAAAVLSFLLFAVLGAIIVVFGVNNIIAPLVWFNKAEVAEENKTVFGKLIGTAKTIGGTGILLFRQYVRTLPVNM